jgi:putative hydrolase of the HAD superfamily
MVKTVFFDFGGVIAFDPGMEIVHKMAVFAGIADEKEFFRQLMVGRHDFDRGTLKGLDYYRQTLAACGAGALDEEGLKVLVDMDINSWTNLDPESMALVRDLRQAGLRTGIFSNQPHEFRDRIWPNLPVAQFFNIGIYSCDLELAKPDPAIYRIAIEAAGCAPGEIVFFDDRRDNIDRAKELGIRGCLWQGAAEARKTLVQFSVLKE